MNTKHVGVTPLIVGVAGAVAQGATEYGILGDSRRLMTERSTGNMAMWIKSTAGQITVTQQVSYNGDDWQDPVDSAGSALGVVVSGMVAGTKYIAFSPALAKYSRFKVVEGNNAATTVTMQLIRQEVI